MLSGNSAGHFRGQKTNGYGYEGYDCEHWRDLLLDKFKKFTTMYHDITLKERYVRDFGLAPRGLEMNRGDRSAEGASFEASYGRNGNSQVKGSYPDRTLERLNSVVFC
jgi:hypothetical protein